MAGGLARRPKPVTPVAVPEPEPELDADDDAITDVVVLGEPIDAEVVGAVESVEVADEPPLDAPLLDPEEHFLTDGDPVEKPREQAD